MDFEETLLEIMKEAKNLPESELETIPGTSVKVKKGKSDEFTHNAYFYYKDYAKENNIIELDGQKVDYITEAYRLLDNKVLEETNEYYISKANEVINEAKTELERFENLKKSLKTVNDNYRLAQKEIDSLYANPINSDEWHQKVKATNENLTYIMNARASLPSQIIDAKNKVNEKILLAIEEQLEWLRKSFERTLKTDVAVAIDGRTILPTDKEKYDSLYALSQIIKTANSKNNVENLVSVSGVMVVDIEQKEAVESLLSKNDLFEKISTTKVETKEEKKSNAELIAKITEELKRLERKRNPEYEKIGLLEDVISNKELKGLESERTPEYEKIGLLEGVISNDLEEYQLLLEVLKYLHKADDSKYTPVSVWDIAYVMREDKVAFEKLISKTQFFNGYNPNTKKVEENEKLIQELEKYLELLATNYINQKGVTNVSGVLADDKKTLVKENDLDEYNRILKIIELLSKKEQKLFGVWGIGNVASEDISKFKTLVNSTKYFADKTPEIPENEVEIKRVLHEIASLISKAKDSKSETVEVQGFTVLKEDKEKLDLLIKKRGYLEVSRASSDLEAIDGVKIDSNYVRKYQEINNKLNLLNQAQNVQTTSLGDTRSVESHESPTKADDVQPINNPTEEQTSEAIPLSEAPQSRSLETEPMPLGSGANDSINENINEEEIQKVKSQMGALMDKFESPVYGKISEEDKELYDLLKEKLKYLVDAKNSIDRVQIGNVWVESEKADRYREIENKIKSINNNINIDAIKKVEARMQAILEHANNNPTSKLYYNAKVLEEDAEEYGLLQHKLAVLKNAKTAEDVVQINGVTIAKNQASFYQSLEEQLKRIPEKKKIHEENLKNKKSKVNIRKLKDTSLAWIKQNWKKLRAKKLRERINELSLIATKKSIDMPKIIPTFKVTQNNLVNAQIEYERDSEFVQNNPSGLEEIDYEIIEENNNEVQERIDERVEALNKEINAANNFDEGNLESASNVAPSENPSQATVIEVPTGDEILSQLNNGNTEENATSLNKLEELRFEKLKEEASRLQSILNETKEPLIRAGYEKRIQEINNEIERISKKGRGL